MFTKITSVDALNKVLATSEFPIDFRVKLNGGMYTTKSIIRLGEDKYSILNGIDDSEDYLTSSDLFDTARSVIGEAMVRGGFYAEGDFNSLVENHVIEVDAVQAAVEKCLSSTVGGYKLPEFPIIEQEIPIERLELSDDTKARISEALAIDNTYSLDNIAKAELTTGIGSIDEKCKGGFKRDEFLCIAASYSVPYIFVDSCRHMYTAAMSEITIEDINKIHSEWDEYLFKKASAKTARAWLKSMKKDKKLLDRRPKARRRIFKGMYIKSLENDGRRLQLPRTQQLLSSKHMLTPKEIRHIKLASKNLPGVSELL